MLIFLFVGWLVGIAVHVSNYYDSVRLQGEGEMTQWVRASATVPDTLL